MPTSSAGRQRLDHWPLCWSGSSLVPLPVERPRAPLRYSAGTSTWHQSAKRHIAIAIMSLTRNELEECIGSIHSYSVPSSDLYGRLLNWTDGFVWHYGIGLSETHIFDTGQGLRVFRFTTPPKQVIGVENKLYDRVQTIERLTHALRVFHKWNYGLLGWNCEHLARLIAHDDPISYEVIKSPWPIPSLNNNGRHPTAREDLRRHLQANAPHLTCRQEPLG